MKSAQGKAKRNSAPVILTTLQGKILLQLRDEIVGIEYPGYWSLLAGWIEKGETPSDAIQRELHEELEGFNGQKLSFGPLTFLGSDKRSDRPWIEYVFHTQVLTPAVYLSIKEGRALAEFTFAQCERLGKLAPHHRAYLNRYRYRIETELTFGHSLADNHQR